MDIQKFYVDIEAKDRERMKKTMPCQCGKTMRHKYNMKELYSIALEEQEEAKGTYICSYCSHQISMIE